MTITYAYLNLTTHEDIEQLPKEIKAILIHDNSCVKCENFPKCPNPKKSKTHSCPQFSKRVSKHATQDSSSN